MNLFLKRNAPVFIVGAIVLVIFVAAIVIGQVTKPGVAPLLKRVDDDFDQEELNQTPSTRTPTITNVPPLQDPETGRTYINPKEKVDLEQKKKHIERSTLSSDEVREKFGVLEISFTQDGFDPKNVNAYVGQIVRWTNNSSETITLSQLIKKYDEWQQDKNIEPGKTLEFIISEERIWPYKENNSGKTASITGVIATIID